MSRIGTLVLLGCFGDGSDAGVGWRGGRLYGPYKPREGPLNGSTVLVGPWGAPHRVHGRSKRDLPRVRDGSRKGRRCVPTNRTN